ncbi:MAG: hypothetical protein M1831_005777 [Alyxoria varia]|nr:MAG: hypothetical protein M1831_005777 [Alyxoria varia]
MPLKTFLHRLSCTKPAPTPSHSSHSTASLPIYPPASELQGETQHSQAQATPQALEQRLTDEQQSAAVGESSREPDTRFEGLERFRRARVREGRGGRKLARNAEKSDREGEDEGTVGRGAVGGSRGQESGSGTAGGGTAEGSGEGLGRTDEDDDAAANARWMAVVREAAKMDREDRERARGGGRVGTGDTRGTRSGYNQQDLGFEPGQI